MKRKNRAEKSNRTSKRETIQSDAPATPQKETVLICVTGMSPAIITETVWALAHEKPSIRPNRVIAFATTRSRESVVRELLDSGVWGKLRHALKAEEDELIFSAAGDHIRVFTKRGKELDDLRTADDNNAAADFILENLRSFTDNPDVRIVASIAGGRKTMGALLYACMTLLGRNDDRVTHVLVPEELEKRTSPKFYFPSNAKEGKAIEMADVPFVSLRDLFPREWGRMPGPFMALVAKYGRRIQELLPQIKLTVYRSRCLIEISGEEVRLSPREHLLMLFLAERAKRKDPPFQAYKDADTHIENMRQQLVAGKTDLFTDWRSELGEKKISSEDDIRKLLSSISRKLGSKGSAGLALAKKLPHKGSFGLHLEPEQITIVD